MGEAFYATNDEDVAETYGDRVIPIFLNLKNPYVVNDPDFTSPHSAGSFAKSLNVSTDKVSDLLKSQGYDGVIAKDEDMDYVEYAVYNSTQIKSATENVGTYNRENPDIRWSIREDSEIEKIDRQHRELYDRYMGGDKAAYEEAAKLVADFAESKGYNRDLYHGSPNKNITEFRDESYFTENKDYARRYKKGEDGRIYEVRANLKKPFDTRNPKEREIFEKEFYGKWGNGAPLSERGLPDWTDGSDLWEFLQEKGYDYDSMVLDEGSDGGYGDSVKWRGESYVPMKSSAVKLQDPFTFDDNGELIPLSKRFDSGNPDMRWKVDADFSEISAKLEKIIDSLSDKKNQHIEILRKVSDAKADFLLRKTGLDLKGYSHSIDNYSILHILKKHGSKKELQRGQIPVTIEDIRIFPTIVSDYDNVEYVGKSNIGRDTIRFEKSIGGNNVLVFEEMRVGKKLLALSTMYIQKRKKSTSNANASSNTSETLSTSFRFSRIGKCARKSRKKFAAEVFVEARPHGESRNLGFDCACKGNIPRTQNNRREARNRPALLQVRRNEARIRRFTRKGNCRPV